MIKIREDNCQKLSGITSLFLSFKFNSEIINVIKSYDKYVFDKKTYEWELPVNALSYLLDNLTYIDDIELHLYKDDGRIKCSHKKEDYPEWIFEIINKLYDKN